MKENQTDLINKLGIGAFTFISINELSGLLEYLIENVLIITRSDPKLIIWLPQTISFILFAILVIWSIKIIKQPTEQNPQRTLNTLIFIWFIILLSQFLITYFGTEILLDNYSEEFDFYHNADKGSLIFRGYLAFIPILHYLIFAIILLLKRKTVANNV